MDTTEIPQGYPHEGRTGADPERINPHLAPEELCGVDSRAYGEELLYLPGNGPLRRDHHVYPQLSRPGGAVGILHPSCPGDHSLHPGTTGDPAGHYIDLVMVGAGYQEVRVAAGTDARLFEHRRSGTVPPYNHYVELVLGLGGPLVVALHNGDIVPLLGKAGSYTEPYLSSSDYHDLHLLLHPPGGIRQPLLCQ